MRNDNAQTGWLPENLAQETQLSDAFCEYVLRPTSITPYPFAFAKNISVESFEDLADLPEDGQQALLPSEAYICLNVLQERANAIGFCEMYWQGKDGRYWKELHIFDEETGECQIFFEQIC